MAKVGEAVVTDKADNANNANKVTPIERARRFVANTQAITSQLISRMQLSVRAGLSFGGKRDLYKTFGYDRLLDYNKYYARYQRNGLATRIVNCWAEATWRKPPSVFDVDDSK